MIKNPIPVTAGGSPWIFHPKNSIIIANTINDIPEIRFINSPI
jgi:hypothetical protein